MAKEHEMLSLGGQAAAAAHSSWHTSIYHKNNYTRSFKTIQGSKRYNARSRTSI